MNYKSSNFTRPTKHMYMKNMIPKITHVNKIYLSQYLKKSHKVMMSEI